MDGWPHGWPGAVVFQKGGAGLGAAGRKKLTSFYLSVQSKSIG